jgi:hypothetical protein
VLPFKELDERGEAHMEPQDQMTWLRDEADAVLASRPRSTSSTIARWGHWKQPWRCKICLKTSARETCTREPTSTSDCECKKAVLRHDDYKATKVGIDETKGRFGEVEIWRCNRCSRPWLHYFVEYEAFTASGRWFIGAVSEDVAASVTPEGAVAVLSGLPGYFRGGSYFGGPVTLSSGEPSVG